jgi:N-acetylglucosamine kinase-like BadF-type ATPase
MRYVLGADGGGSKIACLVAEETGRLLGYSLGGPVNTNYVVRQQAVDSMSYAIQTALEVAGLRGQQIETLCLSAPMAPEAVAEAAKACGIGPVTRAAEGQTPRWAARYWTDMRIGITVDAGTGSMARGWARDGREAGSGGWGSTLGDEGSGHWISMQAMVAVLQAHDGRIAETRLTAPVLRHFGMSDILDMVFQVSQGLVKAMDAEQGVGPDSGFERPETGSPPVGGVLIHKRTRPGPLARHEVATLCPTVVSVARQGDWKAIEILERAGHELGRLGVALIRRLGMEKEEFAIVPFGGVFRAKELVLDSFRATICAAAPRARVVEPRFEPVVGAALLALSEIGVAIDDPIISAVEATATRFPACLAPGMTADDTTRHP